MKNHIEYMYVIFLTASGKNYGCFAFDKTDLSNGEVRIGASFCNPDDRKEFSKKEARKVAEARLSKDDAIFALDSDDCTYQLDNVDVNNEELADMYFSRNLDYTYLSDLTDEYTVDKVVHCKSSSDDVPSWVAKAVKNGAVSYTLKNDNLSVQDLAAYLDEQYNTRVLYSLFVDLKNSTQSFLVNTSNSLIECTLESLTEDNAS